MYDTIFYSKILKQFRTYIGNKIPFCQCFNLRRTSPTLVVTLEKLHKMGASIEMMMMPVNLYVRGGRCILES